MPYPVAEYSRGLATAFLQELEKRNQRIVSQLESISGARRRSARERERVVSRFEKVFSRMPTCRSGRGNSFRLFVCTMDRAYRNPIQDWDEDGFSIGKLDVLSNGEPNLSVVVSRHVIERILERASDHCVDGSGNPDIFALYPFFYDLPLWSEVIFQFKVFILLSEGLSGDDPSETLRLDDDFLDMSFLVPTKSGVFLCKAFRTHLFVRTYLDASLLDDGQKYVVQKLNSVPASFRTKRLTFHREVGGMAGADAQCKSDRLRIWIFSQYLAKLVDSQPYAFFRNDAAGAPVHLLGRIKKIATGGTSIKDIEEIFNITAALDDVGFKRFTGRISRLNKLRNDR